MAGELEAARLRLTERKEAAGLVEAMLADDDGLEAAARRALAGLDLDFDELMQHAATRRKSSTTLHALTGMEAGLLASGQFIDGVAIGPLVAEARAKAGAA